MNPVAAANPRLSLARPPLVVWLVFAFTALLYRNAILNHFYTFGSSTDSFWFAGTLWHGDLALHGPPGIDIRPFYLVHVAPLLVLPALLSHVLPFTPQEWLAIVLGSMHALATAALCWSVCLAVDGSEREAKTQLLAGAIALAFGFCAMQAQFMGLPHFEIAVSALLIAFMAALALRKQPLALCLFILLLGSREDAGLHLFSFLAPLVVLVRWREGYWLREELRYGLAALVYAVMVIVVVPQFIPFHQSLFREHYVGDPAFAHVTWAAVQERVHYFFLQSAYQWAPLLALLLAALWRRDLLTAVGAVAVVPWILLHTLTGLHPTVWTMGFYYAFPVLGSLAWPTLLRLYAKAPVKLFVSSKHWLPLQAAVVLLASLPMFGKDLQFYGSRFGFISFSSPASLAALDRYEDFTELLRTSRSSLGNLVANLPAIGIDPFTLERGEWLEALPQDDAQALARIDTVLLFASPFSCPDADKLLRQLQLPTAWDVIGTRLRLYTRKSPQELAAFATVLAPSPPRQQQCSVPVAAATR